MNYSTKTFLISAYAALQMASSVSAQDSANGQTSTSANPPVSKSKSNEVIYLKDGSGVVVDGVLYLTAPHAKEDSATKQTPNENSVQSAPSNTAIPDTQDNQEPVDDGKGAQPKQSRQGKKSLLKGIGGKAYFWRLKYYFIAQSDTDCDVFYGLVQDDPLIGLASVDFSFPNGCNCHGRALVTQYPMQGVAGEKGKIKVKCDDGRTLKGDFTTTSLTTGWGSIHDDAGHTYSGTFGHSLDQAIRAVNQIRQRRGCPDIDKKEVEMLLQGKVLPKHTGDK
jgi:hypothetical protein